MDQKTGFVFANNESPGDLNSAAAGDLVALPSFEPPYIVVNHSLDRVSITRWPGRLLRVERVPPEDEAEREALARAAEGVPPDAGYTRAISVKVVEALPPGLLFGPHGDSVVAVIDAAYSLEESDAELLAEARDPRSDTAYGGAWDRWLADQDNDAYYLGGNEGATVIDGAGRWTSPIGKGFGVIGSGVFETARARSGAGAPVLDENGDWALSHPWHGALGALLHAAMALGAPELLDGGDAARMTAPWAALRRGGEIRGQEPGHG